MDPCSTSRPKPTTKDEIKSLISQSDKDNSMRVDFQQFLEILILKMSEKDS